MRIRREGGRFEHLKIDSNVWLSFGSTRVTIKSSHLTKKSARWITKRDNNDCNNYCRMCSFLHCKKEKLSVNTKILDISPTSRVNMWLLQMIIKSMRTYLGDGVPTHTFEHVHVIEDILWTFLIYVLYNNIRMLYNSMSGTARLFKLRIHFISLSYMSISKYINL